MTEDRSISLTLMFGLNQIEISKDSVFRLMAGGLQGVESSSYFLGTEQSAIIDGSYIVSKKFEARSISITFGISDKDNIEAYRRLLLRYLNPLEEGTLIVERSGVSRKINVVVNGSITFSQDNIIQDYLHVTVNLLCPDPWFYDTKETVKEFKQVVPLFTFPFNSIVNVGITAGVYYYSDLVTINNTGDADMGIVVEIEATGDVENPAVILLDGQETGVKTLLSITTGDNVTISTVPRQKNVELNGETTFLFDRSSVFFQVPRGETMIQVYASSGSDKMINTIRYRMKYLGV